MFNLQFSLIYGKINKYFKKSRFVLLPSETNYTFEKVLFVNQFDI